MSRSSFWPAPVEVGIAPDGLRTVALERDSLTVTDISAPIMPGDLIVVSGGARGVTAEAAFALAQAFRPTLLLLGRSPMPEAEPDWLNGLTAEPQIKQALARHATGNISPKLVEREYRGFLAGREIRTNLARIEATGAKVVYRTVDVRDADAVTAVFGELREQLGPVCGVVHGAGTIADRLIDDKTDEQWQQVYSTKIDGLRALLGAARNDELKLLVLFSSFTGRYGRKGQVDYAVANEVLNKMAQQYARQFPACRVVSANWGPWDGGMVSPGLKELFRNEGVELIPLQAGAKYLVQQVSQPTGRPVEVVVMGASAQQVAAATTAAAPTDFELALERELDVKRFPFLLSHVVGGKAVLPIAVLVEWLTHGAIHGNPGLELNGFEGLRLFKGVRLAEGGSYPIRVLAGKAQPQDDRFVVPVRLIGEESGREILHAGTEVVLGPALLQQRDARLAVPQRSYPHSPAHIYSDLLFHGPQLQGLEHIEGCSEQGIAALARCAPPPSAWIDEPLRGSWLADPLALDCALQLGILWNLEMRGTASLPCFIGSYRQYQPLLS